MVSSKDLIKTLMKLKNARKAKSTAPYLGIKPGFYGDGDKLLGVSMPNIRQAIKDFHCALPLHEVKILIESEYHEIRMAGVLILLNQYKKAVNNKQRKKFYEFYIENVTKNNINNWDFIDITAPSLIGHYLYEKPDKGRSILMDYAASSSVWLRRVAVISTYYHIKQEHYVITLELGKFLLTDEHHLIHKGVGWMLREIGKRDEKSLLRFLDNHHKVMPRVMLRYSIERIPQNLRKHYMKK